jgi:hypothetical protein
MFATSSGARRFWSRRGIVLFGAALLIWAMAAPAGASLMKGERHCVVEAVGQQPDGRLITRSLGCYGSFSEAITVASGGSVKLAASTPGSAAFDDAGLAGVLSTFTLGIHYDGYYGSGSSITVTGSSCTGGWWNTPSWFDNRISSSYNGCTHLRHYDYPNRSGAWADTYGAGQTDNLWGFSNRTESVQYFGS